MGSIGVGVCLPAAAGAALWGDFLLSLCVGEGVLPGCWAWGGWWVCFSLVLFPGGMMAWLWSGPDSVLVMVWLKQSVV